MEARFFSLNTVPPGVAAPGCQGWKKEGTRVQACSPKSAVPRSQPSQERARTRPARSAAGSCGPHAWVPGAGRSLSGRLCSGHKLGLGAQGWTVWVPCPTLMSAHGRSHPRGSSPVTEPPLPTGGPGKLCGAPPGHGLLPTPKQFFKALDMGKLKPGDQLTQSHQHTKFRKSQNGTPVPY